MPTPYKPNPAKPAQGPGVSVHFSCQACGNSFPSSKEQMAVQPVCPKCRTYGRILGPDGRPVMAQRKGSTASPMAAAGVGQHEAVEVDFAVAHGKKDNSALLRMIFVIVGGIVFVVFLGILVSNLQSGAAARKKAEREEVLDTAKYDDAISKAVSKVRTSLAAGGRCQVMETEAVSDVLDAMASSPGFVKPNWTTPPKPGSPYKNYTFVVSHTDANGAKHTGFIVLLYYKKLDEVNAAASQLTTLLPSNAFARSVQPDLWFIAYYAVNLKGPVLDALVQAKGIGAASDFEQFRKRTGIAGDD
ncbi:MAG: hypothetical protein IT461_10620 [Planctomycetes bacterium]|jgi:hypothetical protein|nr:hypothetical protein [Planctomycetota bacterium]